MISINPFKFGEAVRGGYFTDREKEIEDLLLDLRSGQNVIIYSPRRFGKTSLILEVMERLKKEGCLCVYIDLFPITSKREFAQKLYSSIAKSTSSKIEEVIQRLKDLLPKITPKIVLKGEGDMEFDVEFEERTGDIERLLDSLYDLPQKIAQKRNKRVIIVFDEFQQIGELDGEKIEKELRSKIQHHPNVAYVFMGSKQHLIERIFNDKARPFYKGGKRFKLDKIPKDEFSIFIKKRLEETRVKIEQDLIDYVLGITDSHPHYTQAIMQNIWNESYPSKIVTKESIERGKEQLFRHHQDEFIKLWDSLSPKQKNLLIALTSEGKTLLSAQATIVKYELGSAATVNKSLKKLLQEGILERENGGYIFPDIFFKEWVKRRGYYPTEDILIKPPLPPLLLSLHNQIPPEPNFVGRKETLEVITQWYKSEDIKIGTLIGWGGSGKSALARKWYDSLDKNSIKPDSIFWWGFYRNPYLDRFLEELLRYLNRGRIDVSGIKTSWQKAERIKEFITDAEYLIVLDGLEEMQKEEKEGLGAMKDRDFQEILRYIADSRFKGLCLITTRLPLTDLRGYPSYKTLDIEELSNEDTRLLFRKIGVSGSDEEIDAIWRDFGGHTLSLVLLANYLGAGGNINKAKEILPFYQDKEVGGKTHRILLWYDKQLNEDQRRFMEIFSLFRQAVGENEFEGVFQDRIKIEPFHFKRMVDDLCHRRLISKGSDDTYTTHPLIKGYFEAIFGEKEKIACYKTIYEYFGKKAKDKPE